MLKGLILGAGALAYLHYVHVASLAINHRLDNFRSLYSSSVALASNPDADLTYLVK